MKEQWIVRGVTKAEFCKWLDLNARWNGQSVHTGAAGADCALRLEICEIGDGCELFIECDQGAQGRRQGLAWEIGKRWTLEKPGETEQERRRRVVRVMYERGCTDRETARALGISPRSVQRIKQALGLTRARGA